MFTLLPILIFGVIIAMVAVGVFLGSRPPRIIEHGAACANCGYGYSGWTICPECGKPASQSGIITRDLWKKFHVDPTGVVLGWLFMSLIASGFLVQGVDSLIDLAGYETVNREIVAEAITTDRERIEYVVSVNAMLRNGVLKGGTARIELHSDPRGQNARLHGEVASVEVNLTTGLTRVIDRAGNTVGTFDEFSAEAAAALHRVGGFADPASIKPGMDTLVAGVGAVAASKSHALPGYSSSSSGFITDEVAFPVAILGVYKPYHKWTIMSLAFVVAACGIRWSLRQRAVAFAPTTTRESSNHVDLTAR